MTASEPRATECVRILHLTDSHLFAGNEGEFRGIVTRESLSATLRHHEQSGWQADVVYVTGDLIQDDSAEAYETFKEILRPVSRPVYCIPGNHDVRGLMRNALRSPPFHYCAATESANWLLIGLDSCESGSAGGAIVAEEFDRLDAAISNSVAEHVMVCLHHPPVPMGSKWLDTVGLRNGDEFLDRVAASGRVRLAIFGHVHQAYDGEHHGIRILGTPSTCRQFKPGSDEFALDGQPPAYRRLTLYENGSFDNELVWVEHA